MTRTPVPSLRQQLLLAAAYRNGASVRRVASRLGMSETTLRPEFEALDDLGLVELPTSFYAEGVVPDGSAVRITPEGEGLVHALPTRRELAELRLRLQQDYPTQRAARTFDTETLRAHLDDALRLVAAVDDPGVVGTIQAWIGQELRQRTPGLNGTPAV